jgi:VanZ family protein
MRRDYSSWIPVGLWMGFIFVMSTDLASASHTSRLLDPFLHWVKPTLSDEAADLIHLLVRKSAHLSEYAVLAILVRRALVKSLLVFPREWSWRPAGLAWLSASLYAATDEFHQSFVATRTPAAGDVVIDSIGAALGLGLLYLWLNPPRFRVGYSR